MSHSIDVFYEDLLKGNLIKEIVSVMLQKSGYQVLPHGYEITLSGLSRELCFIPKENSETISRIRTSPDLLVFLPRKQVNENIFEMPDLMLIEVKTRRTFPNSLNFMLYDDTKLENLREYKRYWGDSFLLVALPKGNVFYIQRIEKLAEKSTFNASFRFSFNKYTDSEPFPVLTTDRADTKASTENHFFYVLKHTTDCFHSLNALENN